MIEALFASCLLMAGALGIIGLGVGIVWVFGGKKVRDQIRSEW